MAMRFHCVAAYDDQNNFLEVLYAGADGEKAVQTYHTERDAANFPRLAYFRNPPHSKRCSTVKKGETPEAPAPVPVEGDPGGGGNGLEGEEDDDSGDLADIVARAGKGRGKGKG